MSWVFVRRDEKVEEAAAVKDSCGLSVETAGPPSRGYESVAEPRGRERVAGYAALGTSPDGVMSLRGLLFPPSFYIPFSFHSIP